jgi:hypothetical protein
MRSPDDILDALAAEIFHQARSIVRDSSSVRREKAIDCSLLRARRSLDPPSLAATAFGFINKLDISPAGFRRNLVS